MNALCLITLLFCSVFQPDSLQNAYENYVAKSSPEKLYVHMDRTYFCQGETLWFNAYLKNASEYALAAESNYIYVELLDSKGKAVQRVKVKRDRESFPGQLELADDLPGGEYVLRAYSLWQMNGPCEYMFNQKLTIYDKSRKRARQNEEAKDIDISFYPEGGRHFGGSKSIIGFKVMDDKGRSVDLTADLVDGEGTVLAQVSTTHDGMGSLVFFPNFGKHYFLRTQGGREYPVPDPSESGACVGVVSSPTRHVITVDGVPGEDYSLWIRDISYLRHLKTFTLQGPQAVAVIPSSLLRPGINHALLLNQSGEIVSERLFYSGDMSKSSPVCTFTAAKPDSRVVGCELNLSEDGAAADGICSVSIVKGQFSSFQQDEGIVSYMNLSSELKGKINNPSYYFDDSVPASERTAALDLLLMIQGWSYYDFTPKVKYPREYTQSITGKISRVLQTKKAPSNFIFYVYIPKLKFNSLVDVDKATSFIIDSLDFEEGTGVLIKADKIGTGADYIPKWDGDSFAPPFRYVSASGRWAGLGAERTDSLFAQAKDLEELNAAVVTADSDEPFIHFQEGRDISRDQMEMFGDRTLVEYLSMVVTGFEYKDEAMYNRRIIGAGFSQAGTSESEEASTPMEVPGEPGKGNVVLVVDGTEQPWAIFDDVRMADIALLNINKNADTFYNSPGGVVSIVLRAGATVSRQESTEPSLLYITPLGYQQPRKFYSPVYEQQGTLAAMGNTLHWEPRVEIVGGKASFSFLEFEPGESCFVRIEGLTSTGHPFSRWIRL